MSEENRSDAKPRKLQLTRDMLNRNSLLERSNFVPQTKTVVVRVNHNTVIDSPTRDREKERERGKLQSGDVSRKLGLLGGLKPAVGKSQSAFLLSRPGAVPGNSGISFKPSGAKEPITKLTSSANGGSSMRSGGSMASLSQLARGTGLSNNNATKNSNFNNNTCNNNSSIASKLPIGMTSLSDKVKLKAAAATAAAAAKQHIRSTHSINTAQCVTQAIINPSFSRPSPGFPASAIAVAPETESLDQHSDNTGLSGVLRAMGKTLSVKGGVMIAPTKASRLLASAGPASANGSSGRDVGDLSSVYGLYNCDAADTVGNYLDSVIKPSTTKTQVPNHSSNIEDSRLLPHEIEEADTLNNRMAPKASKVSEKPDTFNNFVRKNLKSGGTSKHLNRSTSRVSMAKQRWINRKGDQQGGNGGKYGSKYGRTGGSYGGKWQSGDGTNGDDTQSSNAYSKPRGLQQWGLDSLEMSLDLIASSTNSDVLPPDTSPTTHPEKGNLDYESVVGTEDKMDIDEGKSSNIMDSAPIQVENSCMSAKCNLPSTNKSIENYKIKSFDLDNNPIIEATEERTKHIASKGNKTRSAQDKINAKIVARQRENERIQAMTSLAPKCPGHSMVSKLLVVKKSGPNKGKYFYSCTFPAEQRCNFFMWAEDSPELLRHTVCSASSTASQPHHLNNNSPSFSILQERKDYTVRAYATKLQLMNKDELKTEVLSFNRRSAMSGSLRSLNHKGTKEDVISRLLREVVYSLERDGVVDDIDAEEEEHGMHEFCGKGGDEEEKQASANVDGKNNNSRVSIAHKTNSEKQNDESQINMAPTEWSDSAESDVSSGDDEGISDASDDEVYFSDEASEVVAADAGLFDDGDSNDEEEEEEIAECNRVRTHTNVLHADGHDHALSTTTAVGGIVKTVARGRDSIDNMDIFDKSAIAEDSTRSDNSNEEESESSEDHIAAKKRRRQETLRSGNSITVPSTKLKSTKQKESVKMLEKFSDNFDKLEVLLRRHFGFANFRPGQRWAIDRCLTGKNSLLVMPTGAGKSLCYMLPSLDLPGLTVVVSPLIALMQDQQRKLPFGLPGACLSGSLTAQQMMQISEAVLKGHVKVLYVSPERLCTPAFRRLITLLNQQQQYQSYHNQQQQQQVLQFTAVPKPVVSLLCVDEAHCLSQWSYNFRPAFLRIRREIHFIQPASVLALTATATPRIQMDVMRHLGIPSADGLVALPVRRDNLQVSVHHISDEDERRRKIVSLVRNPQIFDPDEDQTIVAYSPGDKRPCPGKKSNSKQKSKTMLTIVYVWRRFEADALAEFLKGSGVSGVAVYHAGIDAGTRARTQLMFDRGKIQCIVATVAFGMGVDKADVRQVIHCTMPKSIESYMQEIGRAGRDGLPSACHLLLQKEDAVQQHSLSHSMELSRIQIAALLLKVFQLRDISSDKDQQGIHQFMEHRPLVSSVSLLLEPLEAAVDISSTVAETILSVLELPPFKLLNIEGTHFDVMTGRFRISTDELAAQDVLVAALIACNTYKAPVANHGIDFSTGADNHNDDGMGDSYGLGFDSSASAINRGITEVEGQESSGWLRDRKLGGNYGGKIQEFECSRLAVAQHARLTPDEVSTGMYKLQKMGVLEYKLQDSALYLTVLPATVNPASPYHFDSYRCSYGGMLSSPSTNCMKKVYLSWVWDIANAVHGSLHTIAAGGSKRIVDMWKATNTIAHFTSKVNAIPSATNSVSNRCIINNSALEAPADAVKDQAKEADTIKPTVLYSSAQSLLEYVMSDADYSTQTNTSSSSSVASTNASNLNISDTEEVDSLSRKMIEMFKTSIGPFDDVLNFEDDGKLEGPIISKNGKKVESSVEKARKLRDRVRDCVNVLQRDPSMLTAVNTILKGSAGVLVHQQQNQHIMQRQEGMVTAPTVAIAKKQLMSLCMCRILHALPSRLFPAQAWRDRSDAWGSFKHVAFEELYAFILDKLSTGF